MRQFKSQFFAMLFVALTIFGADAFARGGGSRSSSSSSRSSSSSSRSSTRSTPSRSTNRSSTIRSTSNTRRETPAVTNNRSTSTNRNDRALTRQNATRQRTAASTYGNRTTAQTAYRSNLTSRNSYTSSTRPTTRPAHVPQNVSVGGRSVNVTYNTLPGGGYGYGYTNSSGVFMALAANQMIVNNAMMSQAGYGQWNTNGTPVVVQRTYNPMGAGVIVFIVFIVVCGVVIAVKFDN